MDAVERPEEPGPDPAGPVGEPGGAVSRPEVFGRRITPRSLPGGRPLGGGGPQFVKIDVGDDRVFLDSAGDPAASVTGPADESITEEPGSSRVLD